MEKLSEPNEFISKLKLSVSSPRAALQLAFICILLLTLAPSLLTALQRRRLFARLPQLPKMGFMGKLLLGNIDIYFYAMRHLTMEEALFEATNGLFQIESVKKKGLVALHLGTMPIVGFFTGDTVGQLMNTGNPSKKQSKTTQTSKGNEFRFLRPWLGQGLVISEGEHWRSHRKLILPTFSSAVLRSMVPSFSSNVEIMLSRVSNSKSNVLDLRPLIKDLALDIVTETTMGRAVGAQFEGTNREEYIEPVKGALECFANRLLNPFHHIDLIYQLSSEGRKNARIVSKIYRYTLKVVEERKRVQREKRGFEDNKFSCFLDLLLETHHQNPKDLTEKEILEEVSSVMFAGQDSTSLTITMALFLVAGDQRVQSLILKELETILAGEADPLRCQITAEHCQQMKYLEAVIKEALRLYSPAPNTSKKIEEEEGLVVNGHRVPKGSSAILLFSLMHQDPVVFPQPNRFIPERFLKLENLPDSTFAHLPRPVPPKAFIPFSTGPRVCLGLRYALLEMKVVLATVLRRYRLVAVTRRDQLSFGIAVILTIRTPVMVRFEERREGFFSTVRGG